MLSGAALDVFKRYKKKQNLPEESDDVKLSSYKKYDSVTERNGMIPHVSESNETKPLLSNVTRSSQGDGGNSVSMKKDLESPEETGKLDCRFELPRYSNLTNGKIIPKLAVELFHLAM